MTEILADSAATDADRWSLVHHLSGVVSLRRVTRWATDQALGYIRSLSEMGLAAEAADLDEHAGSLPSL
ncbi:hypothetical protein [Nonomuraea typhae]|uniref:Uncharacterized protein n=1 Tax=Nonomuraea typhae TaxID=2603600 RepID=A0ABW7YMH1_9ACTN